MNFQTHRIQVVLLFAVLRQTFAVWLRGRLKTTNSENGCYRSKNQTIRDHALSDLPRMHHPLPSSKKSFDS